MQFKIKLHFIRKTGRTSLANSSTNSLQLCSCRKSRALENCAPGHRQPETRLSDQKYGKHLRLSHHLHLSLRFRIRIRIRLCLRLWVCVSGGEVFVWVRKYLKCHIRSSEIKCECCFMLQKRAAEVSNLHCATKFGRKSSLRQATKTGGANLPCSLF